MRKFLKSPWAIAIVPTLLGFLLSVIYDISKQKDVFSTMISGIKFLCKWIVVVLNFEIKLWVLLVVFAVLIGGILFYSSQIEERNKNVKPKFLEYTEDKLKKWKWSWSWRQNSLDGKWYVDNLVAHCPKCDTHMLKGYGIICKCPRCGYEPRYCDNENEHEIEALICDNIRRRFYAEE